MRLDSAHLLRLATVAASIAVLPSIVHAQVPIGRPSTQATPPPVPTVTRPAEGQVVSGDLPITVQMPAGVPARKYTIEGAYWDPARNTWVYPGTVGADFAGGTNANTTIAAEVRLNYSPTAARWRIHVRTVDPPGSWGPWREFTWQAAPPALQRAGTSQPAPAAVQTNTAAPVSSATPPATNVAAAQGQRQPSAVSARPARGAETGTMAPNPGLFTGSIKDSAQDVAAQYDKLMAEAKDQINVLNLQIYELQKQIAGLKVDSKKTQELLDEASKQGAVPWKIDEFKEHLKANDDAIDGCLEQIKSCKQKVKELEKSIANLQKEKATALAKLQATNRRRD